MKNLAVISVDMFQTLVNINSRREHFWKRFPLRGLTKDLAEKYWSLTAELIFKSYDELFRREQEFISSRTIMENSFKQLSLQTGLDFQPREAAQILIEEHGLSSPYEDTEEFLNTVGEHFPICVVSDADDDMILPLMGLYRFDKLFTSEQYQAYKGSPGSKIFHAVIDHYGVAPHKILHIGDSKHDVLGAKRAGLKACWLNRKGRKWQNGPKPTCTVTSLSEIILRLGLQ
ncbi:MAG: HAD family hydrolase [Firmicutes bacterium]|nr:HAD family hydrolase [Bacillota bacterium]